jgi:hypothetical protein
MSEDNSSKNETQVQNGRSPRFTLWVAFLVFGVIAMSSVVELVRLIE